MKLKDGFVIESVGDQFVLIPLGVMAEHFHGIVRLNESAAFIVKQFAEDTSESEVIDAVFEEYEITREDAEMHVKNIVRKLDEIGALA